MDNLSMPTIGKRIYDPATIATPEAVKDYFARHYSYVDFDISDEELKEFLNRSYIIAEPLIRVCDLLYDKLISEGAEVQE
jgi:hypothetical protein